MNYSRQIRGPFVSYRPIGDFGAATIVKIKTLIADDLKDTTLDIAIDLTKMTSIDVTGVRFFANLRKALEQQKREIVFFGGEDSIVSQIQQVDVPFQMFASLEDFEIGFHEMNHQEHQNYFRLAKGNGPVRHLDLLCPICGNDQVKGFILDKSKHALKWSSVEITPYYQYEELDNQIEWESYAVSVCHECLFASSRLDYFHLQVAEGTIPSKLKPDDIDRIGNHIGQRKSVIEYHEDIHYGIFWTMPREKSAAMISWLLNEMTERHIAKDRNHMDAFNIAYSCFMVCKFSKNPSMVDKYLNTAMAWLDGILKTKERYSSVRIAMVYTYLTSMYLFNDKLTDAHKIVEQFSSEFQGEEWARFWLIRAKELYQAELES